MVSFLATSLLVCASALAGDAPPPPAPRVDMVVTVEREAIRGDEAAGAVTLIDRKQIERLPATSLAELLAYLPGLTMMFDGNASGTPMMTSRGFFGGGEVEYVTLLVDGVPAGDAESGNVDWRRFRTSDIERLEVLHGPGSSLYGDTALGGVIELFTRDAEPGHGELALGGGSFGTAEVEGRYVAELGGYRLAVRGGSAGNDGFREHAGSTDRSLQLSLVRDGEHSRLRIDADGSRKDRREPGPLTVAEIGGDRAQSNPLFRFDRDRTERRRLSATYEKFGTTDLLATIRTADRDGDTLRTLLLAPGFGSSALRSLATRTSGTTLEAAHGGFRAGIDFDRASLDGRYAAVGDDGEAHGVTASSRGRRDRRGLFVTGSWKVCERCRLSAGIRRDEIRDDFGSTSHDDTAWSPRVGLNVRAGGASLFVQLSRAFKAATLDQLFDPRPYPNGFGGTFTVSNPELRPQRARNIEAGVFRGGESFDLSLVVYRMHVSDEIDFDPQTFSYRNIGESVHRGIEASVAVAKTSRISTRATYAWTRVADSAAPDRQLKNIPEHVAQLLLHARLPRATSLDLVYRWMHGRTLDDAGLFPMPDVSRVDLRLATDVARLRLQLDLVNALDARYNELGYVLFDFVSRKQAALEFPAPGRTLRAGVTWRF